MDHVLCHLLHPAHNIVHSHGSQNSSSPANPRTAKGCNGRRIQHAKSEAHFARAQCGQGRMRTMAILTLDTYTQVLTRILSAAAFCDACRSRACASCERVLVFIRSTCLQD
jgi:hypothetical protein